MFTVLSPVVHGPEQEVPQTGKRAGDFVVFVNT